MISKPDVPIYVTKNLDYWLTVAETNPDRANPIIDDICARWGI